MEEKNYKQELLKMRVKIKDIKTVCGKVLAIVEFPYYYTVLDEIEEYKDGMRESVVEIYDPEGVGDFFTDLIYEEVYNWVTSNNVDLPPEK